MLWRLKTLSMFVMMTLILVLIGAALSLVFGSSLLIMSVMLVISILLCLYSYFRSKSIALHANHVRIVTEAEEPRLYRIVKGVADKAGIPMPEVGIAPTSMPNAFATGRNPRNAAVVATEGLLDLLPDDELEGVIAHEMAHVKNYDILVMSVASTFAVMVSYISYIAYIVALFSDRRNSSTVLAALLMRITLPMAALLIQLGVSRNREYLADKTGAMIINNPRALARALNHLENGFTYSSRKEAEADNPAADYDFAHMWISNPVKRQGLLTRLFSTHPPMEDRIRCLNELADKMGL